MKIQILLSILLLLSNAFCQTPVNEEFNPGTTWTFTNGAGIQNYGAAENYATTNIGTTPYPNGTNITITSPTYNFTACPNLVISFPLQGRIENGWDFLRFQYRIGVGAYVTIQSFTGIQNATFTYTTIPNTATQFRFLLQTDGSINTYFSGGTTNVYYFDIARFNVVCSVALPVEIIDFSGEESNKLSWRTVSEIGIDRFLVERSVDGVKWESIYLGYSNGEPSTYSFVDSDFSDTVNYYRLVYINQDYEQSVFEKIVAIDNSRSRKLVVAVYDLLGRSARITDEGVLLVVYADGTSEKIVNGR